MAKFITKGKEICISKKNPTNERYDLYEYISTEIDDYVYLDNGCLALCTPTGFNDTYEIKTIININNDIRKITFE